MKISSLSKDMLEEQHSIERTKVDETRAKAGNDDDEVIHAMPISYSLPADSLINETKNQKLEEQHSMERTKVDEANTPPAAKAENDDLEVIDAMPISYSLPANSVLNKMKKKEVATKPDHGKRKRHVSAFGKVNDQPVDKISDDELLKNWIIEIRQRTNGKFDKYYYHKTWKVKCRSKVEVKKFEKDHVLPKRAKKSQATLRINNVEVDMKPSMPTPPEKMSTNKFESAEDFLSDAYNNLLNSCSHPMPNYSTQDLEENTSFACSDDCNEIEYVEDFLRDAYNNLLKSCPHPMPDVSTQENEKRRVEVEIEEEEEEDDDEDTEEEVEAEAEAQAKAEAIPEEKGGEEKSIIIDIPPNDDIQTKSNLQEEEDDIFDHDLFVDLDIPKNF